MDYEEYINSIKSKIWELYYTGILTQEELEKKLNLWKEKYYEEFTYRKMKGKFIVNKSEKPLDN